MSHRSESMNASSRLCLWIGAFGVSALTACGGDDAAGPPERSLGLPAPPSEFQALAAALAHVCADTFNGDGSGAAFDPYRDGPHPLVFIAADGSAHPLNGVIPKSFRPSSADAVELVACTADVRRETVESCEYTGTGSGTIYRYQRWLDVRVVSPRTGRSRLFQIRGSEPDSCPSSTSKLEDIWGGQPTPSSVEEEVIDRYVPVPTCGGARPFASCLQCFRDEVDATPSGCGSPVSDFLEDLPRVRPGQPVPLTWQWEVLHDPLYLPAFGFDWSASPDAALLDRRTGEQVTATPPAAGSYSFLARARLPADESGLTVQTRRYRLEVLAEPVIESVVDSTPVLVRLGLPTGFGLTISGRPQSGRAGEQFRFSWVARPSGSAAAEPTLLFTDSRQWTFEPDLVGDYRVQVEYSDGIGFSEPVISPPITVIDRPVVYVDGTERTGGAGWSMSFQANAGFVIGFPVYTWTLTSKPPDSLLEPELGEGNLGGFTPDVPGAYVVEVVATDDAGTSDPVSIRITATEMPP